MNDADLTRLLAHALATIDGWVYSEVEPYTAEQTGIHYGAIAPSPPRGVGVRVYDSNDYERDHVFGRRAQIRFRGTAYVVDDADRMADQALPVLLALRRDVGIAKVTRQSFLTLGPDGNGRQERTDNYLITLDNEEAQQP